MTVKPTTTTKSRGAFPSLVPDVPLPSFPTFSIGNPEVFPLSLVPDASLPSFLTFLIGNPEFFPGG